MSSTRLAGLFVALVWFAIASNAWGGRAHAQTSGRRQLATQARAACDMAYRVAVKTPGVSVRRRTGTFTDETLREPVFGCGLALTGSFRRSEKTGDASVRLRQAFTDAMWQEMGAYGADGTDGTSFAFQKGTVACLARGTWNGGADDPEVPPEDWYNVAVFCTSPAFPSER